MGIPDVCEALDAQLNAISNACRSLVDVLSDEKSEAITVTEHSKTVLVNMMQLVEALRNHTNQDADVKKLAPWQQLTKVSMALKTKVLEMVEATKAFMEQKDAASKQALKGRAQEVNELVYRGSLQVQAVLVSDRPFDPENFTRLLLEAYGDVSMISGLATAADPRTLPTMLDAGKTLIAKISTLGTDLAKLDPATVGSKQTNFRDSATRFFNACVSCFQDPSPANSETVGKSLALIRTYIEELQSLVTPMGGGIGGGSNCRRGTRRGKQRGNTKTKENAVYPHKFAFRTASSMNKITVVPCSAFVYGYCTVPRSSRSEHPVCALRIAALPTPPPLHACGAHSCPHLASLLSAGPALPGGPASAAAGVHEQGNGGAAGAAGDAPPSRVMPGMIKRGVRLSNLRSMPALQQLRQSQQYEPDLAALVEADGSPPLSGREPVILSPGRKAALGWSASAPAHRPPSAPAPTLLPPPATPAPTLCRSSTDTPVYTDSPTTPNSSRASIRRDEQRRLLMQMGGVAAQGDRDAGAEPHMSVSRRIDLKQLVSLCADLEPPAPPSTNSPREALAISAENPTPNSTTDARGSCEQRRSTESRPPPTAIAPDMSREKIDRALAEWASGASAVEVKRKGKALKSPKSPTAPPKKVDKKKEKEEKKKEEKLKKEEQKMEKEKEKEEKRREKEREREEKARKTVNYGQKPKLPKKAAPAKCKTVFERPLEELMQESASKSPIPRIMVECLEFLENEITREGIFRLSGCVESLAVLRTQYCDANASVNLHTQSDPNTVAALLKRFLLSLPEPLLSFQLYDTLKELAISTPDKRELAEKLAPHIKALSPVRLEVARTLFTFLQRTAAHSGQNMMTATNLAVVFTPTLLRPQVPDALAEMEAGQHLQKAVEAMITHLAIVF